MDTATHATPASASPLAIVVMGVSGSGKTTIAQALAAHYGFRFLDADDYHSVAARAQMAAGQPLTDAMRLPWVELLSATLRDCVQAGESVVLAFSGLRSAHRQLLRNSGVPMRFVFLHAAPQVIAARLSTRAGHFMPPTLLDSQLQTLVLPLDEADVVSVDVDASVPAVVQDAIAQLAAIDPAAVQHASRASERL
ncbi:TPA: AAA family ATPase [Xanthomonas vasicola pv. zeae]|uniref:Gluconokinase n=1 Tax=Xanthomonas vasicola pv. vasculorum TaxID=325776 RepID=A0AAE8F4B3_XANVA|nr:gluconokinase, GntK/IdnK-type [Xanthomonas vasicola]AVQ08773.1 gluconokinase [Xanthomonas vasicola pv. vasculorum]AZM73021.1 gluconokinase [Xanthomonas vasicola pv. vasculorum]KEZ98358.1 gluconokinase [Xanthomonas vasicola pv. vasculorum NCPPB 895]MBV7304334.1 AAA family ATPase [Xanthomonas vasicola pv. vasculorum]MDO6935507.1 gluconokinase, GntK/IdnK-type [Xanthomonas vasicola]